MRFYFTVISHIINQTYSESADSSRRLPALSGLSNVTITDGSRRKPAEKIRIRMFGGNTTEVGVIYTAPMLTFP